MSLPMCQNCLTESPTTTNKPSASPAPSISPSTAPTELTCDPNNEKRLDVTITFDYYSEDISFIVEDACSGVDVIINEGPHDSNSWSYCLNNSKMYLFTIIDEYGDGLCCNYGNGYYSVTYDDDLVGSGGSFMYTETTKFGIGTCSPSASRITK